jgi:multidrug efflux system membrane fusion protein
MIRFPFALIALALSVGTAAAEEVPAVLDWSERVVLSTPVSGVVASVAVKDGERVQAGQVLLGLDDRRLRAQRERAQAQVDRLKLTVEEAEREYARAEELYDRTVISARDLQLAEIDLAMARAELAAARAELTSARVDLEHSVLRAPFDAIVIGTHVAEGETVANALEVRPMISLAASGSMRARGAADSGQLDGLRLGQAAEVAVGERRFRGQVDRIGLEPIPGEPGPRYEISVRFETSDSERPRVGQAARLVLP